jgi:hypothetical protein
MKLRRPMPDVQRMASRAHLGLRVTHLATPSGCKAYLTNFTPDRTSPLISVSKFPGAIFACGDHIFLVGALMTSRFLLLPILSRMTRATVLSASAKWRGQRILCAALAGMLLALGVGRAEAGMIVVNHDEWTFSNTGFSQAANTGTFALNVANFFSGGGAGNFLVLSNNFGLTQSALMTTMTGASHSWTINSALPVTAANLAPYDGVFLAGPTASGATNAAQLTAYVNGGGNVYLAGGTGQFAGGSAAEAAAWNFFLNNFGLGFGTPYNGIGGVIPIVSANALFSGVSALYFDNGNDTLDLLLLDPSQTVIASHNGRGLFAVYNPQAIPEPAPLALFGLGLALLVLMGRRRIA